MKKALMLVVPVLAALPLLSGAALEAKKKAPAAAAAITGGSYEVDSGHTLVSWRVNHFGFNDYFGLFGDATGVLKLDKDKPANSSVDIEIPIKGLYTASQKLEAHMMGDDFFKEKDFPKAEFKSTKVKVKGANATIEGKLTMLGVTKPVTLAAALSGAGTNPFTRKETVGFHATTAIKRSDWGMVYGIPGVTDEVKLDITVAFEKKEGAGADLK